MPFSELHSGINELFYKDIVTYDEHAHILSVSRAICVSTWTSLYKRDYKYSYLFGGMCVTHIVPK